MRLIIATLLLMLTIGCRTMPPCEPETSKHQWGIWRYDPMGFNAGGWVKRWKACQKCNYIYQASANISELRKEKDEQE